MENKKNIKEILSQAKEKRFPSRAIYNLERGFTLFLKKLEKENGENFTLLSCSPSIIIRRTEKMTNETILENDLKFKSLGNYASFILGDKFYYYQFDKYNPLFEDYFAGVNLTNFDAIPDYYLIENANDGHFYNDADIYTNEKTQKYFKSISNCFYNAFLNCKNKKSIYFGKNARPPKKIEQHFYF